MDVLAGCRRGVFRTVSNRFSTIRFASFWICRFEQLIESIIFIGIYKDDLMITKYD